ncbi:uncharacterized protein LOC142353264 [Convolutriloba macropyga]|uniref:uncharacterized protein LOC142353264 n=1 Tax=Convolutriloba macropyga TaxID=536237 RepID=UPI003F522AF6
MMIAAIALCAAVLWMQADLFNEHEYTLIIVNRNPIDLANALLIAIVSVTCISFLVEIALWLSNCVDDCCFQFAILFRFVFILVTAILVIIFNVQLSAFANKEEMKDSMYSSLQRYQGEFLTNPDSMAWNLVQMKYEVCGVNGPGDYTKTPWYKFRTVDYKVVPFTCCIGIVDVYHIDLPRYGAWPEKVYPLVRLNPNSDRIINQCYNMQDPMNPKKRKVMEKGALNPVYDDLTSDYTHNFPLIVLVVFILVCQIAVLIISIAACVTHRKAAKIVAAEMTRQEIEERNRRRQK